MTAWIRSRAALPWLGFALLLLLAPLLLRASLAHQLLSQMGIAVIACLAYNILFGQGGMLSFGHAVYSGLGSFLTLHTLKLVSAGTLVLPVSLLPLVGGLAGLGFAALFGYVSTRKAGTPFAMITLGLGELVWALSLMLPQFFGGEAGVSGNRVAGAQPLGISFGPQRQLYYLIALYCFVCTALMFALTRTPLGRLLNAVRDNPERVGYIGYDTRRVRYLAFMISGFFMGIAGGLGALNFEIVSTEVLGPHRSGAYLLFTFLGGSTVFFGPMVGAVLLVLASVWLSALSKAWLLYLGLVFMLMVMVAPGGVAGLLQAQLQRGPQALRRGAQGLLVLAALPPLAGVVALVEMGYHQQFDGALGLPMRLLGQPLALDTATPWLLAGALVVGGGLVFEAVRRRLLHPRPGRAVRAGRPVTGTAPPASDHASAPALTPTGPERQA